MAWPGFPISPTTLVILMTRPNRCLIIARLAALVIKEALRRVPKLDPKLIEDVIIGCAFPEAEQGMNVARNISFLAGLPLDAGAQTVNRFCASGLQAINNAALNIMTGNGEVFIAGGVESMSHVPMGGYNPSLNPKLMNAPMPEAYISMGITAENVAAKYKVTRQDQDKFSYGSHKKAVEARTSGKFKNELLAVEVTLPDGSKKVLDFDENPRAETTLEKLAALQPVFKEGGTVTAGNSSPLTDGAAALVIMSASKAKSLGIRPLAKIRAFAVAGVDPATMGIGPVPAIQKALKKAGMSIKTIDYLELNEAFAAQALAVVRSLDIDESKVNPHGGAIALGHPLGCTGARLMATLINDLATYNKSIGLESMCVGGGQGCATIIERLN